MLNESEEKRLYKSEKYLIYLSTIISISIFVFITMSLELYSNDILNYKTSGILAIITSISFDIFTFVILSWLMITIKNKELFNSYIFVIFFWIFISTTLILSLITILYIATTNEDIFSSLNLLFYISYSPMILAIIFFIIFVIYLIATNQCPDQLW